MGLLDSLIRADEAGRERFIGAMGDVTGQMQMNRMGQLANDFLKNNDFSRESITKYVTDNNMDPQTAMVFLKQVKEMRDMGPQFGGFEPIPGVEGASAQRNRVTGEYSNILQPKEKKYTPVKFWNTEGNYPVESRSPAEEELFSNSPQYRRGGKPENKQNPELTSLESDIMQMTSKIASIDAGQDIMSEAMGSKRGEVSNSLKLQLKGMLNKYKQMGGDINRFGIQEQKEPKAKTEDDTLIKQALAEEFPPQKYKDKRVKDKETGKEYISNGLQWIEVRKINK